MEEAAVRLVHKDGVLCGFGSADNALSRDNFSCAPEE